MMSDEFPAYPWVPPDAVKLSGYAEIAEVLRSPAMMREPRVADAPFKEGALDGLHGKAHVQRRRIMNRLVRPEAVDFYRDQVLLPTLRSQMLQIAANPDPEGTYRTDLVTLTRSSFVPMLAKLVGMDVADGADVARLMRILTAMRLGAGARFEPEDAQPLIERALEAKEEFRSSYYEPAFANCPVNHGDQPGPGRYDLMSLLAAGVDPHWDDDALKLREAIAMMLASVGATITTITFAVDELSSWLKQHPADRDLVTDVGFLNLVIQESLRLHPTGPVTRIALEDVVLSTGRVIKRGQWVIGSKKAANRGEGLFGSDAESFDPHREVAEGLPRYGLSFGGGPHLCIGLGLIVGNAGAGTAATALRVLYAAGVEPDAERPPSVSASLKPAFAVYPVTFTSPIAAAERVAVWMSSK